MTGGVQSSATLAVTQTGVPAGPHPNWMHLGTVSPSLSELGAVVEARRRHVYQTGANLPDSEKPGFFGKNDLMPFQHYVHALSHADRWRREIYRNGYINEPGVSYAAAAFAQKLYQPGRYTPDVQGWVQYLADAAPVLAAHLPLQGSVARLPEQMREMHTLISAASGWGKSEMLKVLVHHYVQHPTAAVVVLDPHGDLAEQIARFPDLHQSERLVYVQPGLEKGLTVGLNPLDGRGLDEEGAALVAAQIATTLGELVADLTPNMQTAARNCARILLEDGNATLFDLVRLLAPRRRRSNENQPEDPRRAYLVARGRQHPDFTVAEFFKSDIDAESFDSSKAALRNRVLALLSIPSWQAMTCGPATLHLETLMQQRKVIVVNLGPLGSEGGAAMGRLIVGLVAAIGRRREGTPPHARVPCHVFVDEASTMVSPAMGRILAELRKFGIHLTLAQQVGGVGFSEEGKKVLFTNTACKLVGSNERGALKAVFGDADPKGQPPLKEYQFWVRWGQNVEPIRLQVRSDMAQGRHTISDGEWAGVKRRFAASAYYRPAKVVAQAAGAERADPHQPTGRPADVRPPETELPFE